MKQSYFKAQNKTKPSRKVEITKLNASDGQNFEEEGRRREEKRGRGRTEREGGRRKEGEERREGKGGRGKEKGRREEGKVGEGRRELTTRLCEIGKAFFSAFFAF